MPEYNLEELRFLEAVQSLADSLPSQRMKALVDEISEHPEDHSPGIEVMQRRAAREFHDPPDTKMRS